MIPYVFVSSTVEDLHHLRDGVRDTIDELGYTPIMSEYGDIGYLPRTSAEESCYQSLSECQLAILIVGKRYGSRSQSDKSITHNEFRTAKEHRIPVITIVDQEVLSFKRVYDANPEEKKPDCFPGMDAPQDTFALLCELMESPTNNGILPFANVSDARLHLKRQLAHLFGDLLRNQYNALTGSINDVLSEIKTLRHELSGGSAPDSTFLMAIRFLVDKSNDQFRELIEHTSGPIDTAVPLMYDADSFQDFLQKVGYTMKVVELPEEDAKGDTFFKMFDKDMSYGAGFVLRHPTPDRPVSLGHWGTTRSRAVILTPATLEFFNTTYAGLKKIVAGAQQHAGQVSSEVALSASPDEPSA